MAVSRHIIIHTGKKKKHIDLRKKEKKKKTQGEKEKKHKTLLLALIFTGWVREQIKSNSNLLALPLSQIITWPGQASITYQSKWFNIIRTQRGYVLNVVPEDNHMLSRIQSPVCTIPLRHPPYTHNHTHAV